MNGIDVDQRVRDEVGEVLVRYASGIDRRDWELFRRCFTPDCLADYGDIGTWHGVDEITAFMTSSHELCGHTLHRITNIAVDRSEDGVQARSYVDALIMGPDNRDGICAVGYYDDHLVRSESAGWQITRRRYTMVHVDRVAEGFGL